MNTTTIRNMTAGRRMLMADPTWLPDVLRKAGLVCDDDFRRNERGELGTRTSTLDRDGIAKLRESWVYLDKD